MKNYILQGILMSITTIICGWFLISVDTCWKFAIVLLNGLLVGSVFIYFGRKGYIKEKLIERWLTYKGQHIRQIVVYLNATDFTYYPEYEVLLKEKFIDKEINELKKYGHISNEDKKSFERRTSNGQWQLKF